MGKWLAGILATVISSVAVYYLTTQKPSATPIVVEGFVVNAESNALVTDAVVRLDIHGHATTQNTDTEGRFYFSVEGDNLNDAATLEVKAPNYKNYSVNDSLQALGNQIPKLTPEGGEKGKTTVAGARPEQRPVPHYTRRVDAAKLVLQR